MGSRNGSAVSLDRSSAETQLPLPHARAEEPGAPPRAEVVIVGAGPAGATCALALADAGVPSLLIDEAPAAGGRVAPRRAEPLPYLPGLDPRGQRLRAWLAASPHIEHWTGASYLGRMDDGTALVARAGEAVVSLRPTSLVLAPGAIEVTLPLPGYDPVSLGGAQTLLKTSGLVPDGRVLVSGCGPLLYLVAVQLAMAGVEVAGIADAAPAPTARLMQGLLARPSLLAQAAHWRWLLMRLGVPVLSRSVATGWADGVADVIHVDETGAPLRTQRVSVDRVIGGFGLRPAIEAAQQAGCTLAHDRALGGWHVVADPTGVTSVSGVLAIGEVRGIGGADLAQADGLLAAIGWLERAGQPIPTALAQRRARAERLAQRADRFRRALGAWSALPEWVPSLVPDDAVLCRCEGVTVGQVRAAAAPAAAAAKLATRTGMGTCQGRTCAAALALIQGSGLAAIRGGPPGPLPPRWPLVPQPVAALAGLSSSRAATADRGPSETPD